MPSSWHWHCVTRPGRCLARCCSKHGREIPPYSNASSARLASERPVAADAVDADLHVLRNRSVLGIGVGSLLSDAGHEMATAALPGFLASIGAQAAALGF